MQTRMWKSTSGLALVLFSLTTGGCQLLSSDKASEANASASDAPAPAEVVDAQSLESAAPEISAETPQTQVIAASPLTRPTDPDTRVKAIKRGRSNPFAELVAPPSKKAAPKSFGTRSALENSPKPSPTPAARPTRAAAPARSTPAALPRLSKPAPAPSPEPLVLPPLPEATLAKQVKVQGVMLIGNQPRAIIQAPNEDVARTIQAGDSLANGQVTVTAIDMSNPQNPRVVLQEAGQTVSLGVGQGSESVSS